MSSILSLANKTEEEDISLTHSHINRSDKKGCRDSKSRLEFSMKKPSDNAMRLANDKILLEESREEEEDNSGDLWREMESKHYGRERKWYEHG